MRGLISLQCCNIPRMHAQGTWNPLLQTSQGISTEAVSHHRLTWKIDTHDSSPLLQKHMCKEQQQMRRKFLNCEVACNC